MNYNKEIYTQKIAQELAPLQQKIVSHSLYNKVNSVEALNAFMEYHVFAVFDFMSLLKALQIHLTQTQLPWTPKGNPITRRFINEIVLGEESDVDQDGKPLSHYEMYVEAMKASNAATTLIEECINHISKGEDIRTSLHAVKAPKAVQDFVNFTFSIIETNEVHKIATVFTFGREDLIPNMFLEIVKGIDRKHIHVNLDKFIYYLERHIELDGDEHGPLALQMINELCGDDSQKWEDCISVSKEALQHRIDLWTAIEQQIEVLQKRQLA
ncbi:DUF3050 domain-containing protein [Kordia zhangzhouensis]|uniref:DUF3050 domain-containing protein n=1 Tax=Kordia zhangzhouensis TaxID=1620405 RepID=UPI000629D072|nr:DUF3050 domain-containing protein [Kordia zhangzhouensis]